MTEPSETLKDDIAFLRALTKDDGQGLAKQGAVMVAVGGIFGVVTFLYWLIYMGWLGAWGRVAYGLWVAGLVLFFAVGVMLERRFKGQSSAAASRAVDAAWGGTGVSLLAAGIGLQLGGWRLGNPNLALWTFPIVMFTLYGAAWSVAFAVKRRAWFAWVALGCFLTAIAEGALMSSPHEWLLLSAGLLALVAAPGLAILRLSRAGG